MSSLYHGLSTVLFSAVFLASLAGPAVAQVRSSANYAIDAEGFDPAFEKSATSSNYAVRASVNSLGGRATEGGTMTVVRHGIGSALEDVTEVTVTAATATVNEGASRQLDAEAIMSDETTIALDPLEVSWSESSSAITGISVLGVASAAVVYENTVANVNGAYDAVSDGDGFDLTVVNVNADDFGAYGADGIDDDWQVGFFGLPPNANAAPSANPDGDGDENLREFLFGFSPVDGEDFFVLTITGHDTGANTSDLELNKVIEGRTYTVKSSSDLTSPPAAVGTPFSVGSEQADYMFQDAGATGARAFYRVEVTRP